MRQHPPYHYPQEADCFASWIMIRFAHIQSKSAKMAGVSAKWADLLGFKSANIVRGIFSNFYLLSTETFLSRASGGAGVLPGGSYLTTAHPTPCASTPTPLSARCGLLCTVERSRHSRQLIWIMRGQNGIIDAGFGGFLIGSLLTTQ